MSNEYFISDAYLESCHILIGCMLQDKQAAAEIILRMTEKEFIFESHRLIFNTARKEFGGTWDKGIQTMTTKQEKFKNLDYQIEMDLPGFSWRKRNTALSNDESRIKAIIANL